MLWLYKKHTLFPSRRMSDITVLWYQRMKRMCIWSVTMRLYFIYFAIVNVIITDKSEPQNVAWQQTHIGPVCLARTFRVWSGFMCHQYIDWIKVVDPPVEVRPSKCVSIKLVCKVYRYIYNWPTSLYIYIGLYVNYHLFRITCVYSFFMSTDARFWRIKTVPALTMFTMFTIS